MSVVDRVIAKVSGVELPTPAQEIPRPSVPQPVTVPKRSKRLPKKSYVHHLDAPLLQLSAKDSFTLRDAFAGVHIFGSNGSGKTTGSGQTLAKAYLRAGFSGLVLCAKPDERAVWEAYAKACGREDQVIIVSPDSPWRFNFIEYELGRPGDPATRVENLLSTLMLLMEQGGREAGQGGQDRFWYQAAEQLLRNSLMVLSAAQSHYSLFELQQLIDSTPQSVEEAHSTQFQQSPCGQALALAKQAYIAENRQADYAVIENYFLTQFARLAERTRSSITITLSTMLQDLLTGTLRELFSTGTNFFPEDSFDGAIIILDLPTIQNRAHVAAQTLFKTVWQQAALRRMAPEAAQKNSRPIFLWADESHFFATSYDTNYQSLARSARASTVYLTQNLSAYYQRLGGQNPEYTTHALLGYLQTQIFHAQSDPKTIQYMIELFGKTEVTRYNKTYSKNRGSHSAMTTGGSSSGQGQWTHSSSFSSGSNVGETHGFNESVSVEDRLFASEITGLQTGASGIAEAFLFQTGRHWSNGTTILKTEFNRKLR